MSPEAGAGVEAPDFAEPIEAWRVWRVVPHEGGYRLGSVVKATVWEPGEPLLAECLRGTTIVGWIQRRSRKAHLVPKQECECGIYATSLRHIGQYLSDAAMTWPTAAARVLGQVSLWGTVLECERGYRASAAYPLRLYVPSDSALRRHQHHPEEVAAGLEGYGVPVELLPVRRAEAVRVLQQRELAVLREHEA